MLSVHYFRDFRARGGATTMGISKPFDTSGALETKRISEFELLEECILSGQMAPVQIESLMQQDSVFAEWLRARAAARLRG